MAATDLSDVDVVVVGAGPAGSVAAREVARRGYTVTVIEKAVMPRYKPCGGGVTAKAAALAGIDLDPIIERRVSHAIVACGGRRIEAEGDGIGCMVMRADFDAALLRSARQAGARVVEGEPVMRVCDAGAHVEVFTARTGFRARVAIAADGIESIAARSLGIRHGSRVGLAIEAEIRPPDSDLHRAVLFDFDAVPAGYGYIFPKRQHVSAGVYTTRAVQPGLRAILNRSLHAWGLDRGEALSIVGHRVPLGCFGRRRWHAARGLAIGDAGGFADAMWGEGIYYAMKSATIAAAVVDEALRRCAAAPDLASYSRRVWAELGTDLRAAYWCARAFYRLPGSAAAALMHHHPTAAVMMQVLRGGASHADFARTALRHAPAVLLDALR